MSRVDDKFWTLIEPLIEKIIAFNYEALAKRATPVNSVKEMTKTMMKGVMQMKNVVFFHLPNVDSPAWPERIV